MKLLIAIIKELIILIQFAMRKCKNRVNNKIISDMRRGGISIVPNEISKEQCQVIINEIERFLLSDDVNVWSDDIGSDKRIFGFEKISKCFYDVFDIDKYKNIGESYLGTKLPHFFILASRIEEKDGNVGSGGGWHRDSPFTHQFKAIFYLSDVNEKNGPFTYLFKSHSSISKFKDIFKVSLNAFRFNQRQIDSLDYDEIKCCAPSGTMICADTKGIHKGQPIKENVRYTIFFYFFQDEIPSHFKSLMQNN